MNVHPNRWWRVSGGACITGSDASGITIRLPRAETVTLSSSYLHPSGGPRCS